jgi:hypothetical protein
MPSVKILVAACLFAALAPAQDKTRDLPREGISFTLPGAWKWQSDFGSNLAIRMDVDAKGVKYELVGELLSSDTGTVDDEILALEAKVKEGGPDFRDFTVDRNAMLGGQKAVMVRFARLRNEGKDVSEVTRLPSAPRRTPPSLEGRKSSRSGGRGGFRVRRGTRRHAFPRKHPAEDRPRTSVEQYVLVSLVFLTFLDTEPALQGVHFRL